MLEMAIIQASNVNNQNPNMYPNQSGVAVQQDSRWSEDWVPIKNIMNGMIQLDNGHSDISVTLNVYTHVQFDDAQAELLRVAEA